MASLDTAVHREAAEVLLRYATGIDRRDWELLRSCFTEDCDADYGSIGHWRGAGALVAFMREAHEGCGHTLHRITNRVIGPSAEGLDARCYVDALVMGAGNRTGLRTSGFYDDALVLTSSGWRIARRRFTVAAMEAVASEPPVP